MALLLAAGAFSGCAAGRPLPDPAVQLEEQWGVRIDGLRRSAAGYMLDFRFVVTDPEKAAPLLARGIEAKLIDQATGRSYAVPAPPKVGSLRSTTPAPQRGRTYFVLFANPGGRIEPGSKVTVQLGEVRFEGVEVAR